MAQFVTWIENGATRAKAAVEVFCYNFEKKSKADETVSFYVCEEKVRKFCKARIHIKNDTVIRRNGEHNHAPSATRRQALEVIGRAKRQASATDESTGTIIAGVTAGLTDDVAASLPPIRTIKRTVQRARVRAANFPREADNLHDLVIPAEITALSSGENFLIFDSGPGEDRLVIFSTQRKLDLLLTNRRWGIDGTFSDTQQALDYYNPAQFV